MSLTPFADENQQFINVGVVVPLEYRRVGEAFINDYNGMIPQIFKNCPLIPRLVYSIEHIDLISAYIVLLPVPTSHRISLFEPEISKTAVYSDEIWIKTQFFGQGSQDSSMIPSKKIVEFRHRYDDKIELLPIVSMETHRKYDEVVVKTLKKLMRQLETPGESEVACSPCDASTESLWVRFSTFVQQSWWVLGWVVFCTGWIFIGILLLYLLDNQKQIGSIVTLAVVGVYWFVCRKMSGLGLLLSFVVTIFVLSVLIKTLQRINTSWWS